MDEVRNDRWLTSVSTTYLAQQADLDIVQGLATITDRPPQLDLVLQIPAHDLPADLLNLLFVDHRAIELRQDDLGALHSRAVPSDGHSDLERRGESRR